MKHAPFSVALRKPSQSCSYDGSDLFYFLLQSVEIFQAFQMLAYFQSDLLTHNVSDLFQTKANSSEEWVRSVYVKDGPHPNDCHGIKSL